MIIERERPYLAEFALVGIAAVWGLTFPMVQDAVARISTMTFLAYRFLPAAIIVAAVSRDELKRLSREGWRAGALMGAFLTAGYVFQTLGLERTSSSNTGFITGLFVVLTPIFGAVLAPQSGRRRVGCGRRLRGRACSADGRWGSRVEPPGDLLVLLAACSFAFHIRTTDRAVKGYGVGALLVVQLVVCGTFCLAVAAGGGDIRVPDTMVVWSALLVTSLIASALGFLVQTYAQRHASPARTALILASEPAFAGLFVYLLKGETVSAVQCVGAALIPGAIVVVQLIPYLRPARACPKAELGVEHMF